MITCIVVDDEPTAVSVIEDYIQKTPFLKLAVSTTDPLEAIEIVQHRKIDLAFVDIEMSVLSGIDLAAVIQHECDIIFTTAFPEHALKGFELDVIDYLLKPIPFRRFLKAAQKALNKTALTTMDLKPTESNDDFVLVKTECKGRLIRVNFNEVLYIEGLKNYVSIYTKEERVITLISFKELQSKLPYNFIRVHKSYIVPVNNVKGVDGNQVILYNVKPYIPVGETFRTAFFSILHSKVIGGKS